MIYKTKVVRVGPNDDGGYWISESDLQKSECLLSFGINDDWRFEEEFLKIKKIPLSAYDGSISNKRFRNEFLKELLKIIRPIQTINKFRTWRRYLKFFKINSVHYENYVGLNWRGPRDTWVSLPEIIKSAKAQNNIFLKCDIEGGEYRLLNDLVDNQERFTSIVMEFHDVDTRIQEITSFIERINLKLIALNVNNFGPPFGETPTVIECTFSRDFDDQVVPSFPQVKNDNLGYYPELAIGD